MLKVPPSSATFHGAKLDFSRDMSYANYLELDTILSAQHPISNAHDEVLFIIQHQTSELWMKLMLHELQAARNCLKNDHLQPAFKMSARVSRIMTQLLNAWDVLATMTPSEYSEFRHQLGNSSGFQSYQYRIIEFMCGNKNALMLRPHAHHPATVALLEKELNTPSLYDETIQLLARQGYAIDAEVLSRDWTQPYTYNASVEQAWLDVYRNPKQRWALYEWAEELMDLEDTFRQWRFRHVTTVERVIGFKTGTGGTSGVNYLKKMLDVVLFPELWRARTDM
ncbi:MAG: tryptophan 2,3-dioxygenase [Anaerolineae bacterium]|nr:tryptophan 2,3-dioxygenase [Anaerolineae bacterium]